MVLPSQDTFVAEVLCDLADRNHRYAVCNAAFGQLRAILEKTRKRLSSWPGMTTRSAAACAGYEVGGDVEPCKETGADMDIIDGYNVAGHERLNARVLRRW